MDTKDPKIQRKLKEWKLEHLANKPEELDKELERRLSKRNEKVKKYLQSRNSQSNAQTQPNQPNQPLQKEQEPQDPRRKSWDQWAKVQDIFVTTSLDKEWEMGEELSWMDLSDLEKLPEIWAGRISAIHKTESIEKVLSKMKQQSNLNWDKLYQENPMNVSLATIQALLSLQDRDPEPSNSDTE